MQFMLQQGYKSNPADPMLLLLVDTQ